MFEDPNQSSNDPGATALSTEEWINALDRAKEMALYHSGSDEYTGDDGFRDLSSEVSSHANTLNQPEDIAMNLGPSSARGALVKNKPTDSDSSKGKKRFSRRHSKNGLSAVF